MSPKTDAIIIGAGPSGIALAHKLKQKLGFNNFTVYEKLDGPGGTWRSNVYPGCGCDIPTHLYSFSFNLNPTWSKELCEQEEILDYMEATVDKFDFRPHMVFNTSCEGATWLSGEKKWEVRFFEEKTKQRFTKKASIFVSAIGSIAEPRKANFPGMEEFQGTVFHTARWNLDYDYRGKRMALIGNGCSAAQVFPTVAPKVKYLKQYVFPELANRPSLRNPQWYHERPNRDFTSFEKFCFKYVPFWQRYHRYSLFSMSDALVTTYGADDKAKVLRERTEQSAKEYIYATAPNKYHDILVPKFPLGCKRRIFDPGYLEALHRPNVKLAPEGISRIDATGITSESGVREEFDCIVLATGFAVTDFLSPLKVKGRGGVDLHEQWNEHVGAQAYLGMYIHNFPNFALMFGPNTFPAHNSVIFASEVQVDYLAKTLFRPLMDGVADTVEVKEGPENDFVADIDQELSGTVWTAGCSNWYINADGRNSASWPGYALNFWRRTLFPKWKDFTMEGGSSFWILKKGYRTIAGVLFSQPALLCSAAVFGIWAMDNGFPQRLREGMSRMLK
ncbi:FAD/NAD(P)-binding domain-containing protein [Aulographum hederae CBS 113979]|uniref:FAD/NAD(P)-binding domain-containing protein n=1 Tax=Aulographum hederae CBS 113979 TaxID=1176131 RepID=A0A6G1GV29_9PEZI|nr:FAD/NAD(P)-binding domain-containing protein [Aulographum hederae CBS 113979]